MLKQLEMLAQFRLVESALDEAQDPSAGVIEAETATTWGKREGADGRKFWYKPEGFAEWMEDFRKSKRPLPMFYNHNDGAMPIGEWTEFEMTDEGMKAKGRLFLNTTEGSNIYNIMKESPRLINSVSIGAYAEEYSWLGNEGEELGRGEEDDGYFHIKKGGLREVSIVMNPNNPKAEVSKLEACLREDRSVDLKEVERLLRDEVGLERAEATAAASLLKKVIDLREASVEPTEAETSEAREEQAAVSVEDQDMAELLAEMELRELNQALTAKLKGI